MHEIDRVRDAIRATPRGVLVTIVRAHGSTYRRAGARAVIAEDGRATGAISGGCLERDLAERIRPWLAEMQPRLVTYDSTRTDDLVFGLGLGCRGILELLIEPFDAAHPPRLLNFAWNGREPVEWTTRLPDGDTLVELIPPERAIVVFGGGPDVEPVLVLARQTGWRADAVTTRDPVDVTAYDAAVVMTHNFERDVEALRALLASRIRYIGILGPRSRGDELLAKLGASRDSRIFSPVGLDLGAETPEEIALSIVSEIQAVLSASSARSLRESTTAIHELEDKRGDGLQPVAMFDIATG
ncbi:MAG TPA: XdhC family protein [Thermoanaerobaculia bacterium]|nr:XdhC family protein [Thermoanaerobaculia bacterium]